MAKPDVVEFCHSIEGFHGPERALACAAVDAARAVFRF